jgi:pimeloyl-ACP methyl ester carboxylesterase
MPDSPFDKAVIMSVPPAASFRPFTKVPDAGRLLAGLPRQLVRSWYITYFQLPWLPERSASWVVPRLWKQWSPGYRADEDVALVLDAIGAPANWRAALGYYRATMRGSRPPDRYADLHRYWLSAPVLPTLYLHGTDDGCASADYARWVEPVLPAGSHVEIVDGAGHFMQLDRPDVVAGHILDFVGR